MNQDSPEKRRNKRQKARNSVDKRGTSVLVLILVK
jgi:hypothetical protein